MGKNKKKQKPFQHQRTPPPATSQPEPTPEPTPAQIMNPDAQENQVVELTATNGPVSTEGISEPVGATLADCLKRAEELLGNARALFEKARSVERANKAEEERQLTQKYEVAEALLQKNNACNDEIAASKRALKQEELDVRDSSDAVRKRETEAANREASFAEQSARLAEREWNAEQGFFVEQARILKPVEDEVKRLRVERDRLEAEVAGRHEKAEDELRTKAATRAEKWAQEDAQRTAKDAGARRQFDEDLGRERHDKLEALRAALASERDKAEEAWRRELERRTSLLNAREVALDARDQELTEKLKAQRASELDLHVEQELHNEDRAGLERKVERLVTEKTEMLRSEAEGSKKLLEDARSNRDAYWKDLESRKELDRRFGDRAPEEILSALTAAEKDRDTFAQQLRERLDTRAAERLAQLERDRSSWLEERALLQSDLAKAQGELSTRRLAAIELESLKKQKEALEVYKQLLDGSLEELRTRVDELTRQEHHRNPMTALTSLDEKEELQAVMHRATPFGNRTLTLKDFAIDLRHRIARGVEGRTLYYAERDVRAFLGGLAMTRLMLLQGISGTGKTSLPLAFRTAVGAEIEIVEVQAGWRDRQDLVGYYNAFHRHYYATNFLQALYRAGTPACQDRLFLMVLDEINLSRPEQFFADFLSALEQPMDKRRLTLVNDPVTNAPKLMVDGRHLPIPPNVWFIGTANHDESTTEFADKTYDRAHVMELPRKTEAANFTVDFKGPRNPISYKDLEGAFDTAAKNQAPAVEKATQWLRKASFAEDLQQRFRVGWGNRLEHQLARYLPVVVESGGTVGEAMDHLLVTKVLRKLKDRHDVRAAALESLRESLTKAWSNLDAATSPERSLALIDGEVAAKKGEDLT